MNGIMIQAEQFTTGNACSYHYHDDGNGNVVEITNVSASMAASYRYDAFGRTMANRALQRHQLIPLNYIRKS